MEDDLREDSTLGPAHRAPRGLLLWSCPHTLTPRSPRAVPAPGHSQSSSHLPSSLTAEGLRLRYSFCLEHSSLSCSLSQIPLALQISGQISSEAPLTALTEPDFSLRRRAPCLSPPCGFSPVHLDEHVSQVHLPSAGWTVPVYACPESPGPSAWH